MHSLTNQARITTMLPNNQADHSSTNIPSFTQNGCPKYVVRKLNSDDKKYSELEEYL